ncbi:MAG: 3'-5' exonuclease [Verrucomicrobiales bacterium]|nr:3'-5' exonuclease [Verrucomicrobiales bacterium]
MLIRDTAFAAIDFESAGTTRGSTDAPVQLGLAVLSGGELPPEWQFRSYLHTDQPVAWAASRVHGIRKEDLQGAPSLLDLWPRLNATLRSRVVVAHGKGTEKRFLRAFPLHGFAPWVDTLQVAQAAYPEHPDFSLEALTTSLELLPAVQAICPALSFHDALFDAVASLLVLRRIIADAGLADAPVDALCCPERSTYFARRRWRH